MGPLAALPWQASGQLNLSLGIPLDMAQNKAELATYEAESALKRQKIEQGVELAPNNAQDDQPVVPIVPFEERPDPIRTPPPPTTH